jgi:hypothetical protein
MIQIATSIEQSKKLLELGLSSESADMCWAFPCAIAEKVEDIPPQLYVEQYCSADIAPAWSLSRLESKIPCGITNEDGDTYLFNKWNRLDGSWKAAYHLDDNEYISFTGNSFEVIYDMIVWLLENDFPLTF